MNIFLSIIDTINILLKAIRYSVINIPFEDSSSKLIQLSCFLNPFYFINYKISKGQRLKKFLEKVNKFDYRAVFLTIFYLGVAIIFYVSADDTDNRYLLLVAGLVLMLTYGLYAYSFLESPNLNQIADSTYFLGFLFTLTSIAASLINLGDVNDQTITKGVSMFGFALSTTIIGLLFKIKMCMILELLRGVFFYVRLRSVVL